VTLRVVLLSRIWDKAVARMLDSQSFSWPGVQQLPVSEDSENAA